MDDKHKYRKTLVKDKLTLLKRIGIIFKIILSPLSLNQSLFYQDFKHLNPPADYLNNLTNSNMNNVGTIDYCNKDETHCHDGVLNLHTQEFPRLSSSYTNTLYDSDKKPWGNKSDPVYFDWEADATEFSYDNKSGY